MVAASPVHQAEPKVEPTPIEHAQAKAKAAAKAGKDADMPIRFNIPKAEEFADAGVEYLAAPDLRYIAKKVIEETGEDLSHIDLAHVDFAWKLKGGKQNGKARYGQCRKQDDVAKFHGGNTWLIWLAADHCLFMASNPTACKALVYHELAHIGFAYNEQSGETVPKINPHDVEMFYGEVRHFGLWRLDLTVAEDVFKQARIPGI
jgi:hypothetical protein